MLAVVGVVVALLAAIAGWFFIQKKPEPVAQPPPKAEVEPETKGKAGGGTKGGGSAQAKKKEPKAGNHPNMLCLFKGHTGDVTNFKFSPSGKFAGTVGEDRKVIIWDLAKLPPTQSLNLSPELDHGAAVAFSPDDKYVAVAYARSKEVKVYERKAAKEGARGSFASGHSHDIIALEWAAGGRYLAVCAEGAKDNIRVFKPSGESLGTINPGALETYGIAISPDSRFITAATMQCDAKVWEVGAGKDGGIAKVMELTGRSGGGGAKGHSAAVHSVDFGGTTPAVLNAESKFAATASKDGTAKLWNIGVRYQFAEDPKCTLTVEAPDSKPVRHVAVAAGEQPAWLATFSNSAGLCFFSVPGGALALRVPLADVGDVRQMRFSPASLGGSEAVLATVSSDGKTRLWAPSR